jgi:hypothetical protein
MRPLCRFGLVRWQQHRYQRRHTNQTASDGLSAAKEKGQIRWSSKVGPRGDLKTVGVGLASEPCVQAICQFWAWVTLTLRV